MEKRIPEALTLPVCADTAHADLESDTMYNELYQRLLSEPLAATIDYYAQRLPSSPTAIEYLERSALSRNAALRVGFGDRTLGRQIPSKTTKAGRELRQRLQAAGVLKDNGREALRGMLTVPLEVGGQITGIFGQRIDRHSREPAQITIGGGIFNAQALNRFEELIITDHLLDAWAFYSSGHTHVVCAVNHQLTIEECSGLRRVLLASPAIDCEALSVSKCEIHRLKLPEGQSAHGLVLSRQQNQDPLGDLLRAATWQSGSAVQVPNSMSSTVDAANSDSASAASTITPAVTAPPIASPLPKPIDDFQVTLNEQEIILLSGGSRWRVRGLDRNTLSGAMKVNLLVTSLENDRFHVDCFDLYHARSRRVFTAEASEELGSAESELRSQLGRVLLKLEELQTQQRSLTTSPKPTQMSPPEREAALALLQDEHLLDRILCDFEACGVVGERHGKLLGYLCATSRLLEKPLGLVIQSSSAAGKTSLAEAILNFMPPEARIVCSSMTSQSLYYLGGEDLRHKILSIAEHEGLRDASYQLKLLQSDGKLSLIATAKESGSGRTTAERYETEGPVALMMTTTSPRLDPELLNRCLVVPVDEDAAQTRAIHALQRSGETLAGLEQAAQRQRLVELHQNAQRLLRPVIVINPYADQLRFPEHQVRHRRDQTKYLTLIKTIAFLHQHQREVKTIQPGHQSFEVIEVTRHDIQLAGCLADWALGRSLDELAAPARRLLAQVVDYVTAQATLQAISPSQVRFTRRVLRETLGWQATQLAFHLEELCKSEYVVAHGRQRGKLYEYSLLYGGQDSGGTLPALGLVTADMLHEPTAAPLGP